jgi:hypothetical protein
LSSTVTAASGLLPQWDACRSFYRTLNEGNA